MTFTPRRYRPYVAAAAFVLSLTALAQTPPPLPNPSIPLLTNGDVHAIAATPDGGVILGGEFTSIGGTRRQNLARLKPDGTLDPDWNPGVDGSVLALAVDASGEVFVGGAFATIGGAAIDEIAKVAPDGSVDTAWALHPFQQVRALALGEDGALYAAGQFQEIGGVARNYIAKLSTATGAVDPAFNPGADSWVHQLAVRGNAVYVSGEFETFGGMPRRYLAKVDAATGAVDPSWDPSPLYYPSAIVAGADGYVYAGGYLNEIGGVQFPYFARVSATTGVVDVGFAPVLDGPVTSIELDDAGSVFIGGMFVTIDGAPRLHLAKLSAATGAADAGWAGSVDDLGELTWPATFVEATALAGGKLHVGGGFTLAGGETHIGAATFDASGAVTGRSDAGRSGTVYALSPAADGGTYVGGEFYVAGSEGRRHLLRLLPDGTLDPAWNPGVDGPVQSIARDPGGAVYIAGQFFHVGGAARTHFAKLRGDAVDPVWNVSIGGDLGYDFYALAVGHDDSLYAGGLFYFSFGGFWDGSQQRQFLMKLSGDDGSLDVDWNPAPDGQVRALAVGADGSIYAGGDFATIDGAPAFGAVKLDPATGAVDSAWDLGLTGSVSALLASGDDTLYLGGYFGSAGGETVAGMARVTQSVPPRVDMSWLPSLPGNLRAMTIVGSALYIGGDICSNCVPDAFLERIALDGDGTPDPQWMPSPDFGVHALAPGVGGAVLTGGVFTSIGGAFREGLAALPATAGDAILASGFDR